MIGFARRQLGSKLAEEFKRKFRTKIMSTSGSYIQYRANDGTTKMININEQDGIAVRRIRNHLADLDFEYSYQLRFALYLHLRERLQ